MDQQAMSLNDVTATVDELTDFSQDTAERTIRMATATEEQTQKLTDTAERVHTLLDKTTRLRRSLETFEYDNTTAETVPSVESLSQS
jgi:methyl-accepting chemotaxis protein